MLVSGVHHVLGSRTVPREWGVVLRVGEGTKSKGASSIVTDCIN